MIACWIGAGGNLGQVEDTLASACRQLRSSPGIVSVRSSRHYRSAPMGALAGDVYTNAVFGCMTELSPLALLDLLQQIEADHGRTRSLVWGPRTLDLDLLYYGDQLCALPRLTLPHPGRIYRRFVLDPLAELAPDWRDPIFHVTVQHLRERLLCPPRQLLLPDDWDAALISAIATRLEQTCGDVACQRQSQADLSSGLIVSAQPVAAGLPYVTCPETLSGQELTDWLLAIATAAFTIPHPVDAPGTGDSPRMGES